MNSQNLKNLFGLKIKKIEHLEDEGIRSNGYGEHYIITLSNGCKLIIYGYAAAGYEHVEMMHTVDWPKSKIK